MTAKPLADVTFSPAQLALIEQMFPAVVFPAVISEAQLRHYNGQQTVVHYIRERTRGVDPHRQHIPAPR